MPKKVDTKLRLAQYNPWVISKTLKVSDTKHEIRLPKKETIEEIIKRWAWGNVSENNGRSVEVKLFDWDTEITYNVSVTTDARGYFLSGGWFLVSVHRQLKEGDNVGFCWDNVHNTLIFKVLSKNVV